MKSSKGFTLIEVLVVLVILGIFAAVIVAGVTDGFGEGYNECNDRGGVMIRDSRNIEQCIEPGQNYPYEGGR